MRTTNEIMSQFGGHAKYVSFKFSGDRWTATFKSNADEHTENGDTIEDAMENLLVWYSKTKDPKHIADKLHETVKKVLNAAAEIDNQYGDSPRKIVENITKICADTLASMETDNNGKLIFGSEFKQEQKPKESPKPVQAKPPVQTRGSRPKKEIGDDGLPPYFEVKTPSFMFVRCYGCNNEGERVFINIDMQNYKNTSISTVKLNKGDFDEESIIPIAEDEFNSRYDEAANLIMNATNYQPIDYSNVEIIKED